MIPEFEEANIPKNTTYCITEDQDVYLRLHNGHWVYLGNGTNVILDKICDPF